MLFGPTLQKERWMEVRYELVGGRVNVGFSASSPPTRKMVIKERINRKSRMCFVMLHEVPFLVFAPLRNNGQHEMAKYFV